MNYIKNLIIIFMLILLTGCARECQEFDRAIQVKEKEVVIKQYSGGKLIRTFKFKGMVNSSSSSDGYYFTIGDTLYEVSGDVQIMVAQ